MVPPKIVRWRTESPGERWHVALRTRSATEYRECAKRLKLAAQTAFLEETREQLLLTAKDYEE